jgi:hypothetical protein
MTPDDLGLGCIRNPSRGWNEQISVIDKLEDEHQFFGTWADKNVPGVTIDIQGLFMMFTDSLPQLLKPLDGQVIFFMGVQFQFLYDSLRYRKGRLAETHFENFPAIGQEFI